MKGIGKMEALCAQAGREFGEAIKRGLRIALAYAIVESVDEQAKTVNAVVDGEKVFRDIALDVVPGGGNSVFLIPAVDSVVILGFIEGQPESAFIAQTTTVDKIVVSNAPDDKSEVTITQESIAVKRGTSTWSMQDGKVSWTADMTEINGAKQGGLVLIESLTSSLNSLVTYINSHTHSNGAGGYPTGAPIAKASRFSKSSYENTKVKQ